LPSAPPERRGDLRKPLPALSWKERRFI